MAPDGGVHVTDWAWLATQRDRWLWEHSGTRRLWPARLAVDAQAKLAAFTEYVATQAAPAEIPCESAVAMVFFGPPGVPPPEIWTTYTARLERLGSAMPVLGRLNHFDLMLAFGCGWGRDVVLGGQWEGRWEVAYAAMINQVKSSLIATSRLLFDQLPQFTLDEDDLIGLAVDFTLSLLGTCDCGHQRRSQTQLAGSPCSFPPHDLRSWDPSTCHLRPFIDQAVRGGATRRILGGAFAESLLYVALRREQRILRGRVEFKSCPTCETRYEEVVCPSPGCNVPAGTATPRGARPNWLFLPDQWGGNYRKMARWVCGGCQNLYPRRFRLRTVLPADPCPACGWTPSPGERTRTVTVWVRLFLDRAHPRDPDDIMGDPYEVVDEETDDYGG